MSDEELYDQAMERVYSIPMVKEMIEYHKKTIQSIKNTDRFIKKLEKKKKTKQ